MPSLTIDEEITSSSTSTSTGMDSPVIDEVSRLAFPSITFPSTPIFSPSRTRRISPISMSSRSISVTDPSSKTLFAVSGTKSRRDLIFSLDL